MASIQILLFAMALENLLQSAAGYDKMSKKASAIKNSFEEII